MFSAPEPRRFSPPPSADDGRSSVPPVGKASGTPSPEKTLLDDVVQQTLLSLGADQAVHDADVSALRAVAERYSGQPLTLEPVTVELVRAMVRTPFRSLAASVEEWEQMTLSIAGTLYNHAPSRERLTSLWSRLSQGGRYGE